jgi:hypothetical protein
MQILEGSLALGRQLFEAAQGFGLVLIDIEHGKELRDHQ